MRCRAGVWWGSDYRVGDFIGLVIGLGVGVWVLKGFMGVVVFFCFVFMVG